MTENDKQDKRGAVLRCFYLCEMVLREKVGMYVDVRSLAFTSKTPWCGEKVTMLSAPLGLFVRPYLKTLKVTSFRTDHKNCALFKFLYKRPKLWKY